MGAHRCSGPLALSAIEDCIACTMIHGLVWGNCLVLTIPSNITLSQPAVSAISFSARHTCTLCHIAFRQNSNDLALRNPTFVFDAIIHFDLL